MRYRNRVAFGAAGVGIVAQPFVVAYALLTAKTDGNSLVDAAALLGLASLCAWFFARIGIQPSIECEHGQLSVRNPLLSYRAWLSDVQFVAGDGQIGLRIDGIGMVHPWVLSRSLFDSKHARSARKELRELITEAHVTTSSEILADGDPPAHRWVRRGATDLLLVPPLAFSVWNVIDILMGN
ncbi:hypothetical protein [Streptomyces sp. LaPpAH-108]|uniref:hypothetical protein n=1 Tax=Streptomyces sp. LaPpAH-108 TaxID=1155714 RepID=UPI0003699F36|nr:hypothetical protein [Streptomyces sp. LaPpAH-108]